MFKGREQHFDSLDAFLQYISATMHIDHGGDDSAIQARDVNFYGPHLSDFLMHCQNLTGEFPDLVAHVDALVNQIEPDIPPTPSVKRRRVWAKQGSSINPHRVLRGQLSTAWKKSRRETIMSHQGAVCIVVPTCYACRWGQREVAWMAAVPLALAQALEASGRRCELWGFNYNPKNIWDRITPLRSLVRLKAADEPWSLHGPVYTIHRAFARRLVFRLMETLGPVTGAYGWSGYQQDVFDAQAVDALQDFAGVPASQIICGPWPWTTPIRNAERAIAWISAKLAALNTPQEVI